MFHSDQLLSREGPLAYVWLAANVEKKLTKQQLLNTSITESTKAIESSSAPTTATITATVVTDSQPEPHVQQRPMEVEPLALRLTGQLLYGVVRIYSRKTKYLYDDVTDALLKLKSSFNTSSSVILPPESTVITSMKHVILQDTVTEADLLFQQPLNFDQLLNSQVPTTGAAGANTNGRSIADAFQSQFSSMEDHDGFSDSLVDHTLEVPRGTEIDELAGVDDDLELDLDFDLDGTNTNNNQNDHNSSIEAARDTHEPNASAMPDTEIHDNDLPDLGFDDDYALPDFDEPHVPSPEEEEGPEEPRTPESTSIQEIPFDENDDEQSKKQKQQQRKKARKPRVFENTDVVRTSRKRIVSDEVIEVPGDEMRFNQNNYPAHIQQLGVKPDLKEQLQLVKDASKPSVVSWLDTFDLHTYKRRKLATADKEASNDHDDDFLGDVDDLGFDQPPPLDDVNFDITPGVENGEPDQDQEANQEDENAFAAGDLLPEFDEEIESFENRRAGINDDEEGADAATTKATVQIAAHLREVFTDTDLSTSSSTSFENDVNENKKATTLTQIMQLDLQSDQPLSKNGKREATRTFFELLVLATADAVSLKQERLFGEVEVSSRPALLSKFL
ncbi:unnamed protein product [Ambrosiozyma monospora]|uniref:Unnamed protein product n=1 Tax=Ambrosiozyma monospora TaxID=43982 RepID=A0A9W6Z1G0_AMBMO|nr:unnamed protein product [Ambrosiozyma monospora]